MGVSIQELYQNIKRLLANPDMATALIILVVGVASFWLGRFSVGGNVQRPPDKSYTESSAAIQALPPSSETARGTVAKDSFQPLPAQPNMAEEGGYVASKSGTKYHLPWCGGAKQIKEENKIWFKTKAEAEAAGYTPAANCKGI